MTKTRNVGGKITETTKGNDTYFAKEDIVHNSQKKVTFTSDKGVALDKPKKPETKPDLKVTKIEGPFDKDGKQVNEVERGLPYTYKAISSRKPEDAEVLQLKWAYKDDNGNITELKTAVSYNILEGDKVVQRIVLQGTKASSTVYAYYKESEQAQLQVTFKKDKLPMLILQGTRRKGLNRAKTGPADDMLCNDYLPYNAGISKLRKQLTDEVYNAEKQDSFYHVTSREDNAKKVADEKIEKVEEFYKKTDEELFEIFKDDIEIFSSGDLETVAKEMVDRMQQNAGGVYTNLTLTSEAIKHESSKAFIDGVIKVVREYLKEQKGEIDALEITDDSNGKLYDKLIENNISNPKFHDKVSGLGITINDVWAYQVYIQKYKRNATSYDMELQVIYYDHFGLDFPDLQKFNNDIFFSWFVLQHFKGYKPFITKLDIKVTFIGAL